MTIVTKELAEQVAAKLKAEMHPKKNRPHDLYVVFYNGIRVAQFGVRRGSKKNAGHDFIASKIHVTPRQARLLGQCPMKFDDWIRILKEKRIIR